MFGDTDGHLRQAHHRTVRFGPGQWDRGGQGVVVAHPEHDVAAPPGLDPAGLDRHMVGAERRGQPVNLRLPGFDDWPTSSRATKVSTAAPMRTEDNSGTSGSTSGLPRWEMVRPWCSQMMRQRRRYTR